MLLKNILAEYRFRKGRRYRDVDLLKLASRSSRPTNRAAIELAKLGVPDQICNSLLMNLDALRTYADRNISDETTSILQLAIKYLHDSRGQFFQDVAALYFSKGKRDGFFVEVGTGDGERLSNTFMLEKNFGWRGLMFEPNRDFSNSIKKCRTAILDCRAAFSSDGNILNFTENEDAGELSALTKFSENGGQPKGQQYEVQCITLNTAFKEHAVPTTIDFMSIDTEGAEFEVLTGLDLTKYDVRFLVVEHNGNMQKMQQIAGHLDNYGYTEVCSEISCIDGWFLRR